MSVESCCIHSSSQGKNIPSTVLAADFLSRGITFKLDDAYGGHPMPVHEEPGSVMYKHIKEYMQKIEDDLKSINEWDR